MDKEPDRRYATAHELAEDLASLPGGQADPRPPSDSRRARGEVGTPASRGAEGDRGSRVPGAGHRRPVALVGATQHGPGE